MATDANHLNNLENEHNNNQNTSTSGNSGINEALLAYLKEMNETLHELAKNAQNTSQSNARNNIPSREEFRKRAQRAAEDRKFDRSKRPKFTSKGAPWEDFLDSFQDSLLEGLLGSDFKDKIGRVFEGLADRLGVELDDIPGALGEQFGNFVKNKFNESEFGKRVNKKVSDFKDTAASNIKDTASDFMRKRANGEKFGADDLFNGLFRKNGAATSPFAKSAASEVGKKAAADTASSVANQAATTGGAKLLAAKGGTTALATTSSTALTTGGTAAASSAAAGGIAALGPYALVAVAAIAVIAHVVSCFNSLSAAVDYTKEGFNDLKESMSAAKNRNAESRRKMQENEQKRLKADVNAMIEAPFKILEEAAQKAYDVWDANLRLINATQGYNKADLQSLMGNYAERLRQENLTSVIATTDVTESLAKVLDSGLSGKVAEEFAYLATKLNSAIPTQDFFNYADTYASIAANAIAAGKSESEAIAYANQQMELFASNVLYASRQLAGGFTTGLQDAQSLFESAVQIATAAKTNNSAQIGGVLTSVSAIVGAVAPDLSSSITETIVKAATGGNSEEIVALRSLAGIDAGNTAFLRALANDPQAVFSAMFSNLANMQNMSPDNYMEVAEGLSNIFGLSAEAFQRVDFNYLAQAISEMNVSNAALNENIAHLASGETTTTAEQLKMAQINEYMLEEGLAYVLDNEVARAIQQHMWDEQIANELMESEYAVNLQGSALKFLEGISQTIQSILDFLNPFSMFKKLGNLIATANEASAQQADIRQLLELGKVGQGTAQSLYNLTTRGTNLNLTDSIVTMMGGRSAYEAAHAGTQIFNAITNLHTTATDLRQYGSSMLSSLLQNGLGRIGTNDTVDSEYTWNSIGKSVARAIQKTIPSTTVTTLSLDSSSSAQIAQLSATQQAQSSLADAIAKLTTEEYMRPYVESEDSDAYDKWLASAKSLGIQNLDDALSQLDMDTSDLEAKFAQNKAAAGAEIQAQWVQDQKDWLKQQRDELWPTKMVHLANIESHIKNIDESLLPETNTLLADLIGNSNKLLDSIFRKTSDFYNEWIAYYVEHTAYSAAYKHSDVDKIQRQSNAQQSDAVYALADALTQNTVDLKDPAVQTNAILSQILLVVNAIMQQNDKTSAGTSLAETLNGLALGLIK